MVAMAATVTADATAAVPCFLRCTKIRTVDAERRIEDLLIGDLIPTALAATQPVQWIGSWRHNKNLLHPQSCLVHRWCVDGGR
jgi:hypothetical protein